LPRQLLVRVQGASHRARGGSLRVASHAHASSSREEGIDPPHSIACPKHRNGQPKIQYRLVIVCGVEEGEREREREHALIDGTLYHTRRYRHEPRLTPGELRKGIQAPPTDIRRCLKIIPCKERPKTRKGANRPSRPNPRFHHLSFRRDDRTIRTSGQLHRGIEHKHIHLKILFFPPFFFTPHSLSIEAICYLSYSPA
jgi:hypothetical protein